MSGRAKIAMVTPLPPERTGIADYVAVMLPALAQHFDIDLYASTDRVAIDALGGRFEVHPWQALESNRGRYEQVVYQFGNSPFHSHMVDLLDKVPGVVVLHDFYLSSMFDYMDRLQARPGLFRQELERSHGADAVALLSGQGPAEALKRYPASRRIIDRATAVLVHSEHSGELRAQFFPGLPDAAWYTVPMPQAPSASIASEHRQSIRTRRGIDATDFLLVSFGFLADTKLNLEMLEALSDPRLANDPSLRVVFVGENDPLEYGKALKRKIASMPNASRIGITGFVDTATYADYLAAADCAVQLRARSRGETSKAVHDCMSHALATVVNDYGSFHELPAEAVCRIGAEAVPDELAEVIHALRHDPLKRAVLGMSAKQYMTDTHLAYLVAEHYAEVIGHSARAGNGSAGFSR